jgi:hypothetical protein
LLARARSLSWPIRLTSPSPGIGLAHDEQHEIADVVRRLDHQPPVHIGFARTDARILRNMKRRAFVGEADGNRIAIAVAITVDLAVMVGDRQRALADQLA